MILNRQDAKDAKLRMQVFQTKFIHWEIFWITQTDFIICETPAHRLYE